MNMTLLGSKLLESYEKALKKKNLSEAKRKEIQKPLSPNLLKLPVSRHFLISIPILLISLIKFIFSSSLRAFLVWSCITSAADLLIPV